MNRRRTTSLIAALLALMVVLVGCEDNNSADQADADFTARIAGQFGKAQPPHAYDASQARENLIAAHDALALGADSWTVQHVEGVGVTFECPSVGFPIPLTSQLTNPERWSSNAHGAVTLPQMEPYGVFTGSTAATMGNCVLPNGEVGIFYSESNLSAFMFDVVCDDETQRCEISQDATSSVTIPRLTPDQVNVKVAEGTVPTDGSEE